MTCFLTLLRFALSLPPWFQDAHETRDQRAELYTPVIASICRVAKSDEAAAWLLAQTYSETRLARYVLEERCQDGPPGVRCDEGLARGPWQVHYCKRSAGAWHGATLDARLDAGARFAWWKARWGRYRCKTVAGSFAVQRSGRLCDAPWVRPRVELMWRALEALRKGRQP